MEGSFGSPPFSWRVAAFGQGRRSCGVPARQYTF